MEPSQLILWLASGASNEGPRSRVLVLVPPFLGPGFRLGVRWNRLAETVKTRKTQGETGGKRARYGLKRVNKEGTGGITWRRRRPKRLWTSAPPMPHPCPERQRNTVRLRLNGFGPPFRGRFATVSDRFSGSWCRFLESWGPDGENGEKTGKNGEKMGEKWPKESGSNYGFMANAR